MFPSALGSIDEPMSSMLAQARARIAEDPSMVKHDIMSDDIFSASSMRSETNSAESLPVRPSDFASAIERAEAFALKRLETAMRSRMLNGFNSIERPLMMTGNGADRFMVRSYLIRRMRSKNGSRADTASMTGELARLTEASFTEDRWMPCASSAMPSASSSPIEPGDMRRVNALPSCWWIDTNQSSPLGAKHSIAEVLRPAM